MQDISSYIKDYISGEDVYSSWLETHRFELSPLLGSRLKFLLEEKAFIVLSDDECAWFEEYFLSLVNASNSRPLLPFFSLNGLRVKKNADDELLQDILDLTFPNGYIFVYFGADKHRFARLAKSRSDSLMFIFDEKHDNAFFLDSKDKNKDVKLITIARLINHCISGIIFAKVKI